MSNSTSSSKSVNQAHVIAQGLKEGKRIGFNAKENKFEILSKGQSKEGVTTNLETVARAIENLARQLPSEGPRKMLKAAIEERKEKLDKRVHGFRSLFISKDNRKKNEKAAAKLNDLMQVLLDIYGVKGRKL